MGRGDSRHRLLDDWTKHRPGYLLQSLLDPVEVTLGEFGRVVTQGLHEQLPQLVYNGSGQSHSVQRYPPLIPRVSLHLWPVGGYHSNYLLPTNNP